MKYMSTNVLSVVGVRPIRFLVFSGVVALANIGAGYFLYSGLEFNEGWRYVVSVALAFSVGMVVSHVLNRRYTFSISGRPVVDELRAFLLVSLGGLFLTVLLSSVFDPELMQWLTNRDDTTIDSSLVLVNIDLIGYLAAVGLIAFYSFIGNKAFSFGRDIRFFLSRQIIDGRV